MPILKIYPRRLDVSDRVHACFPLWWPRSRDTDRSVAWKTAIARRLASLGTRSTPPTRRECSPALPVWVRKAACQSIQMQPTWLHVPRPLPFRHDEPLLDLDGSGPQQALPGNERQGRQLPTTVSRPYSRSRHAQRSQPASSTYAAGLRSVYTVFNRENPDSWGQKCCVCQHRLVVVYIMTTSVGAFGRLSESGSASWADAPPAAASAARLQRSRCHASLIVG